jgi:hypothetical protein
MDGGTVTPNGTVNSYWKKKETENIIMYKYNRQVTYYKLGSILPGPPHSGQVSCGIAAVIRKPHFLHFQYANPH